MRKLTLTIVLVMLFVGSVFAQGALFQEGNKFYEAKEYDKAIDSYSKILDQNIESADLYFNLGNAYFKNGDLGHAILNYLKAKRLAPSDQAIIHNLEFAQRFSSVQMEGVELNPVSSFLESLVDGYTLNFLAWVSSIIFILFVLSLILRFGFGYNIASVRSGLVISLILFVIISGLTTFKYRNDYLTRRAVVIAEQPDVYTGASEQSDVELEAAPGLIVEILSESSEFYNVLFENKRRGWIKKGFIAEI